MMRLVANGAGLDLDNVRGALANLLELSLASDLLDLLLEMFVAPIMGGDTLGELFGFGEQKLAGAGFVGGDDDFGVGADEVWVVAITR